MSDPTCQVRPPAAAPGLTQCAIGHCRCAGGPAGRLPQPIIVLESEDLPLQYNDQTWEQGWSTQVGWLQAT